MPRFLCNIAVVKAQVLLGANALWRATALSSQHIFIFNEYYYFQQSSNIPWKTVISHSCKGEYKATTLSTIIAEVVFHFTPTLVNQLFIHMFVLGVLVYIFYVPTTKQLGVPIELYLPNNLSVFPVFFYIFLVVYSRLFSCLLFVTCIFSPVH